MELVSTSIPGVFELRPVIHYDARGFFFESYHQLEFAGLGIEDRFVQDNRFTTSSVVRKRNSVA